MSSSRTLHESTSDLGMGRCLRIRLIRDHAGEPDELWISEGWHDGGDDPRRVLGPLPGWVLTEIHEALGQLLDGDI